jgi:hypothetical protein
MRVDANKCAQENLQCITNLELPDKKEARKKDEHKTKDITKHKI